jgi:hypothetical protein
VFNGNVFDPPSAPKATAAAPKRAAARKTAKAN